MSRQQPAIWPPFFRASLALALTAGFALGGALFAAGALELPVGRWWVAAAQAHGHLQLFGWAGLLVFGVGFHFLPRLRGVPLAHPARARAVLWLLLAGLILRGVAQPALALGIPARGVPHAALLVAAALELLGITVALDVLVRTLRSGAPLAARAGLRTILPLLGVAFGACWLALAVNLLGAIAALRAGDAIIAGRYDRAVVLLALYGFLLPIGVGMSARLFPLYFSTPTPRWGWLRAGLGCGGVGLALRLLAESSGAPRIAPVGQLFLAVGVALFIVALGIFGRLQPRPRQSARAVSDPVYWHALSAYLWLAGAGALQVWDVAGTLAIVPTRPPLDAEIHLLGAGFVTHLILGVGPRLLSGFARRALRREALGWPILALANLAVMLRVAPLLLALLVPPATTNAALGLGGLTGWLALALFALNLGGPARAGTPPGSAPSPRGTTTQAAGANEPVVPRR